MSAITEWVISKKADLVALQQATGIPAWFMAAQMCHESYSDGGLSGLARLHHNYAGLKAARWQQEYGCTAVRMGTWEEINGEAVNLTDAFCKCPDWATWLRVYSALLTGSLYRHALAYAHAPLLYGFQVWEAGWATDSRYIVGIARWMAELAPWYADTQPLAPYPKVKVVTEGGRIICEALKVNDRTIAPVRALSESLGQVVDWDGARVIVKHPGAK